MKTIERVVDEAYETIFKYMAEYYDTDIEEILIEVSTMSEGKTIKRSYIDRESWLGEEETK
jgi:hypothetical protein